MNSSGKLIWPLPALVASIGMAALVGLQGEVYLNAQEVVRVAGVLLTAWLSWISAMIWRLHGYMKQSRGALYGEGDAPGVVRQVTDLEPKLRDLMRELHEDTRSAVTGPMLDLEERVRKLEEWRMEGA